MGTKTILAAIAAVGLGLVFVLTAPVPASNAGELGRLVLKDLAQRLDRIPASGTRQAALVASYDITTDATPFDRVSRDAAFVYDNALTLMAFLAANDVPRAKRIGEALLLLIARDRYFTDGRLRNAYRAGPVVDGKEHHPLPGWWNPGTSQWQEDGYHLGTQTGNMAWAGIALARLSQKTGDQRYLRGAERIADWIAARVRSPLGPGGFTGGNAGPDRDQSRILWKSTEHNADALALFRLLNRLKPNSGYDLLAAEAKGFLDAMWQGSYGRYLVGTRDDGITGNVETTSLDAQIFPLLAMIPENGERIVGLRFAERTMGLQGGFDFNGDRDGIWAEGTAQAALLYRLAGARAMADTLIAGLADLRAPEGLVYATQGPALTTGLSTGINPDQPDFVYYRRPHVGAAAWIVMADLGYNPLGP